MQTKEINSILTAKAKITCLLTPPPLPNLLQSCLQECSNSSLHPLEERCFLQSMGGVLEVWQVSNTSTHSFDCSCWQSSSHPWLNDCLYIGSPCNNELSSILGPIIALEYPQTSRKLSCTYCYTRMIGTIHGFVVL